MILDTTAVSALINGDTGVRDVLGDTGRHQLPVVVIGEYRYGLGMSRREDQLGKLMDRLESESDVLGVDAETARCYSKIKQALRVLGRLIPENDIWIAALAVQHRQPVVSRDAHFDYVKGLKRVTW